MDPTLFRIDWEVLGEVLITIIVLAFLIERALALVLEHRLYIKYLEDWGFKEPIAFALTFAVVKYWQFDALAVIFQADRQTMLGYIITAGIIAGGSKGAVKLFRDVMDIKSTTARAREKEVKAAIR